MLIAQDSPVDGLLVILTYRSDLVRGALAGGVKARGTPAGATGGRLRTFAVAEIRTACALVRAILHVSIPHVTSTFKTRGPIRCRKRTTAQPISV